jgi:5-methylcytosine-specific restriction endonuclease McrA
MGYTTEAVEVDHIIPIRLRRDLAFTRSNLQSMCRTCHASVKQREESAGCRIGSSAEGLPLNEKHHWNG